MWSNYWKTAVRHLSKNTGVSALNVAGLAAGLGLFGLVTYATGQRMKEISVRKVLGAGLPDILYLLCKDFIRLVCVPGSISEPDKGVAGGMKDLQNYRLLRK